MIVHGFTERDSVEEVPGMRKKIDPKGLNTFYKDGYRLEIYEECFEPLISEGISLLELGVKVIRPESFPRLRKVMSPLSYDIAHYCPITAQQPIAVKSINKGC